MEIAALEIARLSEEVDYLRGSLEQESEKRHEAESHLISLSDRLMDLEQEIREDCVAEFEQRLAVELARWKAGVEAEKERGEEHWDRKVEVLERLHITVTQPSDESGVFEGEDKENVLVESLTEENDRLRRELLVLKRELAGRSPIKRKPLHEREDGAMTAAEATASPRGGGGGGGGDNLTKRMERLRVAGDGGARGSTGSTRSTGSSSPKKMRKLNTQQWNVSMDGDDLF